MAFSASKNGKTTASLGAQALKQMRLSPEAVWVENPYSRSEYIVYWHPRQHPADRYPVGYNVYHMCTARMDFTAPHAIKLNAVLVTIPLYRDTTADLTKAEQRYYAVTEVFQDGSEVPLSNPVTINTGFNPPGRRYTMLSPPRIYKEFKRRKHIILQQTGEQVDLLIKKRSGARCSCFNCAYGAVEDPNCLGCFGSSFEGGYCLLPDVRARIMNLQEVLSLQPAGLVLKTNPRGWLVDFPLLRNGDVMARRNGERLEVNNIDYMYHQGILTHQDYDLINKPATDPVYSFPIPPPGP